MMNEILQRLLEINIGGSIAIIFVLLCRFLLKDRYKIFSYVMWSVILFRFLCPVSIEFELSCVGLFSEPIKDIALTQQKTQENLEDLIGEIEPDNIVISQTTPSNTTVHIGEVVFNEPQITVKKLNIPFTVWLIGMSAMLCYGIYCFIKLKIRLIGAVNLKENIYNQNYYKSQTDAHYKTTNIKVR